MLACLASNSFRMTHKPHLANRAIKYCPALLKFMVHLLQNPCIKIIQPCQGNRFDLITFRKYSVRLFMSGLSVCRGKRGHSSLFHKFTLWFVLFRLLTSTDPLAAWTPAVLCFSLPHSLYTARGNTKFNGCSLIIFSFVHVYCKCRSFVLFIRQDFSFLVVRTQSFINLT